MNASCARLLGILAASFINVSIADMNEQRIIVTTEINAPVERAWWHWTTLEGLNSVFQVPAPPIRGNVRIEANGPYELLFNADGALDDKGTEGSRVLAFEKNKMLSLTWRNRPGNAARPYFTHVFIQFEELDKQRTKITLTQSGFGSGPAWQENLAYFRGTWPRVLERLQKRYAGG